MNKLTLEEENELKRARSIAYQRLLAPFPVSSYSFKPGFPVNKNERIYQPLIAIEPRDVAYRLTQVFGLGGWSDSHEAKVEYQTRSSTGGAEAILVRVSYEIKIHSKELDIFSTVTDVGESVLGTDRDNNWFTVPAAQAFKRAATKLGIGCFMYGLKLPASKFEYNKFTSLQDEEQVMAALNKNDAMEDALSAYGFLSQCELTGETVSWDIAAASMHRFGRVLSKEGVKQLLAK